MLQRLGNSFLPAQMHMPITVANGHLSIPPSCHRTHNASSSYLYLELLLMPKTHEESPLLLKSVAASDDESDVSKGVFEV